jgi:amidase
VTRCKKAGLVFMGRSSSPEFGLNPNTEPRLYGSCRNPWNLEYSPGGSSGGLAAAVSAGILPLAHATDGGGSIRIPAAHCGLFGLKPSRGRVSMAPDAGEGWGGLSTGHVVSRTVRDSAMMLDCTAGPEPGDPYTAPMHERSFLEAIARPPRKLRIALMLKDHRGAKLHPECLEAVKRAARAVRRPRSRGRGSGPRSGHGCAAAHECPDLGGQHRAIMLYALEGAGARAQPRRR